MFSDDSAPKKKLGADAPWWAQFVDRVGLPGTVLGLLLYFANGHISDLIEQNRSLVLEMSELFEEQQQVREKQIGILEGNHEVMAALVEAVRGLKNP